MKSPRLVPFAFLTVALLFASPALAEEPAGAPNDMFPGAEEAPPEFPAGSEAFTAPIDRTNLPQWIGVLRQQLQRFETPPPTFPESRQLHDEWTTILKPRIARILQRLDNWQAEGKWAVVEGEAAPNILRPSEWTNFVRDMAQLATELHGAWTQYGKIEIRAKSGPPTSPQLWPRDIPFRLSYPWPTLYRSVLERQQAAANAGSYDGVSYWHLLGRFRHVWDWTWERRLNWYRWLEQQQAKAKFYAAQQAELNATRDMLSQTLLGLQVFIGALQNAEETRMHSICTACRQSDATLREMAETALRDMAIARVEAERYHGDSYAKYGSLLRAWLRRHRAAIGVLDVTADEPAPPAEPAPAATTPPAPGAPAAPVPPEGTR
jgi:hypothetical protein